MPDKFQTLAEWFDAMDRAIPWIQCRLATRSFLVLRITGGIPRLTSAILLDGVF